jgi:hypothetical protein
MTLARLFNAVLTKDVAMEKPWHGLGAELVWTEEELTRRYETSNDLAREWYANRMAKRKAEKDARKVAVANRPFGVRNGRP